MAEERLNAHRIVTLNCGMGRDSIAMLCLLKEGALMHNGRAIRPEEIDAVVHSHTGNEWDHTYHLFRRVRRLCQDIGVLFVQLHKGDDRYHKRPELMADFQSRETVASLAKGDCTENHKILPIRRWICEQARIRFGIRDGRTWTREKRPSHLTLIGFAADEMARLGEGKSSRSPRYMSEAYPLVEMGITKAGEAEVLARHDFDDVRKSGCYCCPYQPPGWYWALRETQPRTFTEVVEYERVAMARNPRMNVTGRKVGGRGGQLLTIPEVVDRWRADNPGATVPDVLAKKYSRCLSEARAAMKADNEKLTQLRRKET